MNLEINNKQNPFGDFKRIADDLMNNHVLLVGDESYRFTSLEFYYHHQEHHADIYSHRHKMQNTSGQWYFHGSGLDITFGSTGVFGGILIRGLKHLGPGTYINGPLLCVQEVFAALGAVNKAEKQDFFITELPWDRMGSLVEPQNVYYSRRVGLNPKTDLTDDVRFYNGLYRFFIHPKETQKDKGNIAPDLLTQGFTEKEINDLFGYKHFK